MGKCQIRISKMMKSIALKKKGASFFEMSFIFMMVLDIYFYSIYKKF